MSLSHGGYVQSLAHPRGDMTGFSLFEPTFGKIHANTQGDCPKHH
jgi:hypothetical protein